MTVRVLRGARPGRPRRDAEAGNVHFCVTSPPYLWLRSYDTEPQVWETGNACACWRPGGPGEHAWGEEGRVSLRGLEPGKQAKAGNTVGRVCPRCSRGGGSASGSAPASGSPCPAGRRGAPGRTRPWTRAPPTGPPRDTEAQKVKESARCRGCGAWRGELGQEPTIDLYVAHLCQVFRAVRRVLRDDGTLWVNLGDSFRPGSRTHRGGTPDEQAASTRHVRPGTSTKAVGWPSGENHERVRPGDTGA